MSIDNLPQIGSYVSAHLHTITNALFNHAERMEAAAQQAQVAYDQGQADPAVREAQDASMITNRGYLGSAMAFTESANEARKVAQRLAELVNDDEAEEDAA